MSMDTSYNSTMLSSTILLFALLIGTVSAAVQQTCHGFDGSSAALRLTAQYNASVLIYQLSEALNKTSIPRYIDEAVLEDPNGGLSICTPSRMERGECKGAKLGEFIFEAGRQELSTCLTKYLTFSSVDNQDPARIKYYNSHLGGTHCVVIWRQEGGFSDVHITEGFGGEGEPPLHWRGEGDYTDLWAFVFLGSTLVLAINALLWGCTFGSAASLEFKEMDTAKLHRNEFVTGLRRFYEPSGTAYSPGTVYHPGMTFTNAPKYTVIPVLSSTLGIAVYGLILEMIFEFFFQSFVTYGGLFSIFTNEPFTFAVSSYSVYLLPVRPYFRETYRIHYSLVALMLWESYKDSCRSVKSFKKTTSKPNRSSAIKRYVAYIGYRCSHYASEKILTFRAVWLGFSIYKYIFPIEFLRPLVVITMTISGYCMDLLIVCSLLCGVFLLLGKVSPWAKHSRAVWVMYLFLVVGGPVLVISLLCLCYYGQKYSRGCLFPGHGEMLFINPYLWDYQMAYYHNAFEFQYEDPSDWLLFFNLLPSMIPVIFWNYVAMLGAMLFLVIVPRPWSVLWNGK